MEPKSLEESIIKVKCCYNQLKQLLEKPKSLMDGLKEKSQQRKKGYKRQTNRNQTKGYHGKSFKMNDNHKNHDMQNKYSPNQYGSSTKQGGTKKTKQPTKKVTKNYHIGNVGVIEDCNIFEIILKRT